MQNCNLVVAKRLGSDINIDIDLRSRMTDCVDDLLRNESGKIYVMPKNYENISATKIRTMIENKENVNSIDKNVLKYIIRNKLYTK